MDGGMTVVDGTRPRDGAGPGVRQFGSSLPDAGVGLLDRVVGIGGLPWPASVELPRRRWRRSPPPAS